MPNATWIRITIGLAAGAMMAVSALTGSSIDQAGLRWIGAVTAGIILLLLAFDKWCWRWWGLRWIVEFSGGRVIYGTWRGTLEYQDNGEGQAGSQRVYMAVHQTYSSVEIYCYFPESNSESWSLAAAIEQGPHRHTLRYIYRQQANAPNRDKNRPTEGACELHLVGCPVHEISGSYYAERGGKGTIRFDGVSSTLAGSASHASSLQYRILEGARTT